MGGALLTIGTGLGFAGLSQFWPLMVVAAVGTLTPTAGDVSIFLPLEQAILAGTVDDRKRTALFARYSIVGTTLAACGALAIGLPGWLATVAGLTPLTATRCMFVVYAALGALSLLLYMNLKRFDVANPAAVARIALGPSKRTVYRLAALFAVDSLGSGLFVQSLLAVWLINRFGAEPGTVGTIFFWAGMASAFSYLAASALSQRIGLINTMVFTHIPANLCLIALPFVHSLGIAMALMLVRGALSQMDVPTRTSYVMAVVTPAERPAAASITAVPRSLATAIGPVLAGYLLTVSGFGWPLIFGGAIKITYDLALLALFRKIKPPEEAER
jgi:predicted MFS family arabinose efflux permease